MTGDLVGVLALSRLTESRNLLASVFHLIQEIQILNPSNPSKMCLEMNFTYVNSSSALCSLFISLST